MYNRRRFISAALLAVAGGVAGCRAGSKDQMDQVEDVYGLGYGLNRLKLEVNGLHFDALSAKPPSGQAPWELVLFLHGFPQFADAWAPILRAVAAQGCHAVAVNQRGYSPGARPGPVAEYSDRYLTADVLGFADQLHAPKFHLVGHDWGGLVAWRVAAEAPGRLLSLTVLSTPHPDAFFEAIAHDADQKARSKYILLFRAPLGLAETVLLAHHASGLRRVYQGKLTAPQVEANVRRFSHDDTLTAALNWYRALDENARTGQIQVPTLYIWGDQDMALGETAALATANYVKGPYRFERLIGKSHWLIEETPDTIISLLEAQLSAHSA